VSAWYVICKLLLLQLIYRLINMKQDNCRVQLYEILKYGRHMVSEMAYNNEILLFIMFSMQFK